MLSNIFFPVSLSFLVAALRQLRITTRESLGECPEGMLMSHRIRVETIPFIIFKAALLLSLLFKLHQIYERRRLRKKMSNKSVAQNLKSLVTMMMSGLFLHLQMRCFRGALDKRAVVQDQTSSSAKAHSIDSSLKPRNMKRQPSKDIFFY